jgi:hypothetical protein
MFHTPNVPTILRKITLRRDDDEGEIELTCLTTFRIPILTIDLARAATRMPIAAHCFSRELHNPLPLWDINEVKFQPPKASYGVLLRTAPDTDAAAAVFDLAAVDSIRVWRPDKDKRDLALELVTSHLLRGDAKDLLDVLRLWEVGKVFLTFEEQQLPLDLDEDDDDDDQPPRHPRAAH